MKFYRNDEKYGGLIFAAFRMTKEGKFNTRNNKVFGWLRRKMGMSNIEKYGEERAKEIASKMSVSMKGKNLGNQNGKKVKKIQVTCPVCGVIGENSIMHRWHFDNCNKPRPAAHNKGKPVSKKVKSILETFGFKKGNIPYNKGRKMKPAPLRECPYCGLISRGSHMTRYHFKNCKKKVVDT